MTGFGTYNMRRDPDEPHEPRDANLRTVVCDDLDAKIGSMAADGFRLDMIVPADAPKAARMSRGDERVHVCVRARSRSSIVSAKNLGKWITGRAGMMYRDLVPGRLNGKLIASHIRLTEGGEVPDYVHYHKVRFQMIYCVRGAIKVVYEAQGEPFVLRPGDCVLQPPEIRHRVLWAEAGSEVVELGMPAVHETWVEHDLTLPTPDIDPDRVFNGQRFVRHIAEHQADINIRDTGISEATKGLADVKVVDLEGAEFDPREYVTARETVFCFVLSGEVGCKSVDGAPKSFLFGDAFLPSEQSAATYILRSAAKILLVGI